MSKSLKTLRRTAASLALLSCCGQVGNAVAADSPSCASGGGKGLIEVNVAALTSDGRLLCFKRRGASRAREIGYVTGLMRRRHARWWASTTVSRTACCMASGTAAACTGSTLTTRSPSSSTKLTVPLTGKSFGVDFNPAADRLRIIGDDGQNLLTT